MLFILVLPQINDAVNASCAFPSSYASHTSSHKSCIIGGMLPKHGNARGTGLVESGKPVYYQVLADE
jgi:hypothetical protein